MTQLSDKRKSLLLNSVAKAQKEDRFAKAEQVMGAKPSGLLTGSALGAEPVLGDHDDDKAIVMIKTALLRENPYNARTYYNPDVVFELSNSIKEDGIQYPLKVCPAEDGYYCLIDGHYRWRGASLADCEEVPCIIEKAQSAKNLYRLSYILNHKRSPQTALDNAIAWQRLLDEGILENQDAIAAFIGASKGVVSKTLSLVKLPEKIKAAISEAPDRFPVTVAYQVYLYAAEHGEQKAELLIKRIVEEELGSRRIEEIREKEATARTRKQRESSNKYPVAIGDDVTGFIREWESGKISLEVTGLPKDQRDIFLERLKAMFAEMDA